MLGALVTIVLLYPGFLSVDSAVALSQARSGFFSDQHPPVVAVVWRYVDKVVPGPFGMLLLQTTAFWLGLRMIADRIPSASQTGRVALMLIVGFIPPVFSIVGAIWKDVVMASLLLLTFGLAGRSKAVWPVALLAVATRHNAVIAVLPAIVFHFAARHRASRSVVLGASGTILLFLTSVTFTKMVVERHDFTSQYVILFDLAGIATTEDRVPSVDECFITHQPLRLTEIRGSYSPTSALTLIGANAPFKSCYDGRAFDELVREWTRSILRNPTAYLRHRLAVSSRLLGWGITPAGYVMMRTDFPPELFPALDVPHESSRLQRGIERLLRSAERSRVFRPWPYLILATACVIWSAVRGRKLPLFLALSGFLYEGTLFFLTPALDYRLSHWLVLSSITAAGWLWLARGRNESA